jgi:hypothetical protein
MLKGRPRSHLCRSSAGCAPPRRGGTAQIAYARAFDMTALRGVQKDLRGAAWLILLLAGTGANLTLRNLAAVFRDGSANGSAFCSPTL